MRPPPQPRPQHRQTLRTQKEPDTLRRTPRYRPTLVDPYRDHLRARRATDPAVPVLQLFREITEQGYTGSLKLLYRYITQGCAEGNRPVITPRRFARLLLTRPDNLRDKDSELLGELTAALPSADRTGRLRPTVRRPPHPGCGQRRQAHQVDHRSPGRRPAPPARLRQRPRTRPGRRRRRPYAPVPQRPH